MSTKTEMDTFYPEQPRKIDLKNSKDQYWSIFEFDGIQVGRIELGTEDKAGLQRLSKGALIVNLALFDRNDNEALRDTQKVNLHEFVRNNMVQPFLDIDRMLDKPHITEYATRNALYWTVEFATEGLELLEGEALTLTAMTVAK